MALGEFTKQLAKDAIGGGAKSMLDSLRPTDLPTISEALGLEKPAASAGADSIGSMIAGQLQAMQKPLKDDEELVVLCNSGFEMLRVLEIFIPSWKLAVLIGIDASKVVTRVIAPFDTIQLVCKVMKAPAGAKATRVRIITPKAA